jgi:hypothetical protein
MSEERRFSVEQANHMLEDLRPRLERIRDARQTVLRHGELVRDRVAADGGGHEGSEYFLAIRTLRAEVEYLAEVGVLLRDPQTGLVDFPFERDGRVVYLCWRADEDVVAHWHPPETGFAGRRPL